MNKDELSKNDVISVDGRLVRIVGDIIENVGEDIEVNINYFDEPQNSYSVPLMSCKPATLTLVRLKAFGFKKTDGDAFNMEFNEEVYLHADDKEKKLKLIDKGKEGIKLSLQCGENCYPDKFMSIPSLHILQNLFRTQIHKEIQLVGELI